MGDKELIERGREFVRSVESAGGKSLVSSLCDALEAAAPEQGEPSDAQVEAAIQAWMANDEEYGDVAMRAALRAALRAAGGVK